MTIIKKTMPLNHSHAFPMGEDRPVVGTNGIWPAKTVTKYLHSTTYNIYIMYLTI